MKTLPIRAAMKPPTRGSSPARSIAAAVPTSTGAIAAGRVRGRAAISQIFTGDGGTSRSPGAALLVGVAPLLPLLAHVEEQGGVVGELLEPGEAVLLRVEAGLQQPQRERREMGHLTAPGDGFALQIGKRDDRVDQTHLEPFTSVVEAAEKPHLLGPLDADVAGEEAGAEASVEAADPGARLAELGVVGGDRQVADEVEDVPAPDRVAGDHRDHGLRGAPDLHVKVADIEPADALTRNLVLADVTVINADPLVPARAEGVRACAGENDRADLEIVTGAEERVAKLGDRLRAEGVPDFGAVDRDLGDPVGALVADITVLGG